MICKLCSGTECSDGINEESYAEIECPCCDNTGCEHCDNGSFRLSQCAKRYVDDGLVRAINMATRCESGYMPSSGGLLEQSAWFLDLWSMLNSEQNKIDAERMSKYK